LYFLLFLSTLNITGGIYTGPFQHHLWEVDPQLLAENKSLDVTVLFALKPRNRDVLEAILQDISDPRSPKYAQYLSSAEVSSISSLSNREIETLLNWLKVDGGFDERMIVMNKHKDLIFLQGPISAFENLLQTRLEWHGHIDSRVTKKYLRSTEDMLLPEKIEKMIEFISINTPIPADDPLWSPGTWHAVPDIGELTVFIGQTGFVIRFSIHCWDPLIASPLCHASQMASSITVKAQELDTLFPPIYFQVPWESWVCYVPLPDSPWRWPVTQGPCNPLNQSAVGCTCGAVIGPLRKYTKFNFTASLLFENPGTQLAEQLNLGRTLTPNVLLDLATPTFIKRLYGIPDQLTCRHGSTMAADEYGYYYNNPDLLKFFNMYGYSVETVPDSAVIGYFPNDPTGPPGAESMLDVELLMSIALNASISYYSVDQCTPLCQNEDYLPWFAYLGHEDEPALVQSISYGDREDTAYNSSNPGAIEFFMRADFEFLKFSLQGLTFIVGSGDNGVCSYPNGEPGCDVAMAEWPGDSPYVTSVGATVLSDRFKPGCGSKWTDLFHFGMECSGVGEITCQADKGCVISSGGGFSNVYPRPWWQENAVAAYLAPENAGKYYPATPGFFNKSGRGYPDVAIWGSMYPVVRFNEPAGFIPESGTSASSPAFGAVITLLNDALLGEGLPPVGFMNPLLYYLAETQPEIFNDITVGSNPCRKGHSNALAPLDCATESFSAMPGWDATTGVGTINFDKMVKAVIALMREKKQQREAAMLQQSKPGIDFLALMSSGNSFLWQVLSLVSFLLALRANFQQQKTQKEDKKEERAKQTSPKEYTGLFTIPNEAEANIMSNVQMYT